MNAQAQTDTTDIQTETPETAIIETRNRVRISLADNKKARWYVVHTYSGHEAKVAEALKQRAQTLNLDNQIVEVLIPTQEKIQIRRGQRKTVNEKIFPGYMLVQMEMTDESWLAVRTTPGVTAFIGSVGKRPTPIPQREVDAIMKFMEVKAPKYKSTFSAGEAVKIVEGPFSDFLGTVDHIDETKGKLSVLVSIFGRETPVELDFAQVSKI